MTSVVETSPSASTPPAAADSFAADVEQIFRRHAAATFFLTARVMRRVLRNELEITSPLIRLPHRKTYVIERDRLLWLAARDELGAEPNSTLPARLMLISRPEDDALARFDRDSLLRYYWQLIYHAHLDYHLQDAVAPSRMSVAMLRERIDRIGQTEFDEVRAVLRQESMLLHPDDQRTVYAEFVAVYCELEKFAPGLLPVYFPSLRDRDLVRQAIAEDCPAESLFQAATPPELQGREPNPQAAPTAPPSAESLPADVAAKPSEWRCRQRLRWAHRFHEQGNAVRSALWYQQAALVAPPELLPETRDGMEAELDALALRLQSALELTDDLAATWRRIAGELALAATHGFWNANARLLYDLQKVCLDHERETYRVDFWKWLRSLGRTPLRRPLPNQRIVLMSKHLHTATQRLGSVQLSPQARGELSHLLYASAEAAERLLRRRLEPFLSHSLHDTGFTANSVVAEVAFEKLVQELLDRVVHRGFLTLGDVRDAISRNQLKMPDLVDAREFLSGDPLLQADQRFALLLDGVYQRGPFYLRWLQRLSSLAFGTSWGRMITLYAAVPYGGAYMAIRGIEHLVAMFQSATGHAPPHAESHAEEHTAAGESSDVAKSEETPAADRAEASAEDSPPAEPDLEMPSFLPQGESSTDHHTLLSQQELAFLVLLLGSVIFVLMHFPHVRSTVVRVLRVVWNIVRWALYDLPLAVLRFPPVAWLMRSLPFMLFRRYLLTPLVLTALYWKILPWIGLTQPPHPISVAVFAGLTIAVFLSRLGRDTEELFWDWVGKTWYRVRVHLIVGLFTLIVDVFRQVMDGLERVLYAVDEWLRFRTGESQITLAIKAVLGAVWAVVHAVVRFAVTLLIEPQINPIKHFPVVTVSHKLLLPLALTNKPTSVPSLLASVFLFFFENLPVQTANTIAATVVMGIPGIFGFLAWEFKENWKLYAANRSQKLRPVVIGSHGETMLRLLSPGFHSGTIPKLYSKRRRNARKSRFRPHLDRRAKFDEKLHHVAEEVRHFVDRELLALLKLSRAFAAIPLTLAEVRLATNRVVIDIVHPDCDRPLEIMISEQSGWLVAGITHAGWTADRLDDRQRRVLQAALAGLYKKGSIDLVREQIESRFVDPRLAYDIAENDLVVWPQRHFDREIAYPLDERPQSHPRPRSAARAAGLSPLPLDDLVFHEHDLPWISWQQFWDREQTDSAVPELLAIRLLPVQR
jgi:hypothetical protein